MSTQENVTKIKLQTAKNLPLELISLKRKLEAIETVWGMNPELAPSLLKSLKLLEINVECGGLGLCFKFHEHYLVGDS